jgi:membrane associated rhomboid family serine protease
MRQYMSEFDSNMRQWFSPAVKWLFYLCVGVFILQLIFEPYLTFWLGASPATTLSKFFLWQLVTYAFLHGGVGHLVVNLLVLWFFGMRLEERWGTERFVKFAVFTAATSVLLHLVLASALYGIHAPQFIIGISGVCYAIMIAFAYYWPDTPIYIYGIFPVQAKILVGIMAIAVLLSSVREASGQIAHWTHLGGFLFGYVFVKFQDFFDRIPVPRIPGRRRRPQYREGGRWRDF